MRVSSFSGYCLGICAATAMLGACAGVRPVQDDTRPSTGAPGAMPQDSAIGTGADRARSWMSPKATSEDLLYVADKGTRDVLVYSYPQGALVGTLTGFNYPTGDCVDAKGDVWIVDMAGESVSEYAHGGSTPLQTLNLPGSGDIYPISCSVDRGSGDLAITTEFYGVYIYQQAKGTPKTYITDWYQDEDCAYDDLGNLFIDATVGYTSGQHAALYELPNRRDRLKRLRFRPGIKFGYAGGIQWDGKQIAFGDEYLPRHYDVALVYQIRKHGDSVKETGSTSLDVDGITEQFWIQGKTLIAPSYQPNQGGQVALYNYPSGGIPVSKITGLDEPVASAVSLAE